jgi:hypothetical protein
MKMLFSLSVKECRVISRFFGFIAIFEPPQNAWDKNFRNECTVTYPPKSRGLSAEPERLSA